MTRYDEDWCRGLAESAASAATNGINLTIVYVVTDTDDGKVAFHLELANGSPVHITPGKLPRGHKADITVTVKEPVLLSILEGSRTRDEAFMAGDLKIEGSYHRWLDELVPLFENSPWLEAWESGV